MKSQRITKRIAIIFAAAVMAMLMGSAAVFAADTNNDGYDDTTGQPINPTEVPAIPANGAHVSKVVRYNDHQNFDLSFSFAAAPTQVTLTQTWDGENTHATQTQPTSACPAVTISPIRVVADSNTTYSADGIRVPKANMSDAELAANTQGVITFGSGSATGADAFPHAGVYAYIITETTDGATTGFNGNAEGTDCLTYDDQEYLMRVYVVNDTDGLAIEHITIQNEAGEKVSRSGVLFTNTYIEEADDLEVKKLVAGSGADMTKSFNFTVNFTAPALINTMADGSTWDPTNITATKLDADGEPTAETVTVSATGEASFTLAHNEEVVFSNLPVGATYIVKETNITGGYTPTGQAVQNAQSRTPRTGSRDTAYTSDSAFVGEAANSYTITNSADDITITGLVLNYLPIILLAILAIAAILVYRAMRRRMIAG